VGAIMALEKKDGNGKSQVLTINVEYNQLETLVKREPLDKEGYSLYPGNINVLILETNGYFELLHKTKGIVSEFINPKYKDATKTTFKKDTRLECMMQDYPKLLQGTNAVVGFTQFERWTSFSAVKNSVEDAKIKQSQNIAAECAASGEADIYRANRKLLKERGGVDVDVDGDERVFRGVKIGVGARIILSPSFGSTQLEILSKFPGGKVRISKQSTLILNGSDIVVKNLDLDGTLVVNATNGAKVVIDGLVLKNKGWEFAPVSETDQVLPMYAIRGYTCKKLEMLKKEYIIAGNFLLNDKTAADVNDKFYTT